jgi:hypothetical protein
VRRARRGRGPTSQGAGVFVGGEADATVDRSAFVGNTSSARDPNGEPGVFDAGFLILDGALTMRDSVVSDNRTTNFAQTTGDILGSGSAFEAHGGGTASNVRITDNITSVTSPGGVAQAAGAVSVLNFDGSPETLHIVDSVIEDNKAIATSVSGTAITQGAGVFNNSLLELRRTVVDDNVGKAFGPSGSNEGAGIWNGVEVSGPPVELTLTDSLVTHNTLLGGSGIVKRGAGLFTSEPITRTRTRIAGNDPDQCFGC